MNITNKANLPETVYRAILNAEAEYSKGGADYSCTELIDPPKITLLKQRHSEEITVDAVDLLWAFLGKLGHKLAETAGADNALIEERLFAEVEGKRISGASDVAQWVYTLEDGGGITDYKFTSVFTMKGTDRIPEWEAQQNIYAWLFRQHGFSVAWLRICAIGRDWRPGEAKRDEQYPARAEIIPLRLWSDAEVEHYIRNRLTVLIGYETLPDEDLPDCDPDDMWAQPEKWAVMKKGNKRAVKLFDNEKDAQALVDQGKGTHIEHRPGRRVRCEEYCSVAPFCKQFQDYQKSRTEAQADDAA